ncbi:MAG: ISKra4 family transposase, partial [Deltaproteobacteria bacterium]
RVVFGGDEARINQWCKLRRDELDEGGVEDVIAAIRQLAGYSEKAKEVCEREIGYFEKNKERMRYGEFRKRGLFVGSGVLEAGCKSVVGQRLKQSGMHWTVKGANSIIALRCCLFSNRWEDFWEFRAAA